MRTVSSFTMLAASFLVASTAQAQLMPNIKFGHLTACVADIEASSNFLSEVFNWQTFVNQASGGTTKAATAKREEWINADGFTVHLVQSSGSNDQQCESVGYPSLTFAATDLSESLEKLERAGYKPIINSANKPQISSRAIVPEFTWPMVTTRNVDVRLTTETNFTTTQKTNVGRVTKPRIDRIALIVRDSEEAAKFYTDVLGMRRHSETVDLDGAANKQSGGIHAVFIDANGIWLALVQPVGPGPLNAYLDQHGDAVIAELIVEVPSVGDFYDLMVSKNSLLLDTGGAPVNPITKAHILEPFKDKIAYFPAELTGGLTIEIVERGDTTTSLLERRDRDWIPLDVKIAK